MKERLLIIWDALIGRTPKELEQIKDIQAEHTKRIERVESAIGLAITDISERFGK